MARTTLNHDISADDQRFCSEFEACTLAPAAFDHRAHVRLAYIYLVAGDTDHAADRMRTGLQNFLRHNNVDVSKYHETITRAWILAVNHFMGRTPAAASADAFIDGNPKLLDSKIMLTHYSAELLFSNEARARFIAPNLDEIPGLTSTSP